MDNVKKKAKYTHQYDVTLKNKERKAKKIAKKLAKAKSRSIKKYGVHKKYGTKHKIKTR